MQQLKNCDWFCANCLRMIDVLTRHGRCPYCDSNAVDLAHRAGMGGMSAQPAAKPEIVLSINM